MDRKKDASPELNEKKESQTASSEIPAQTPSGMDRRGFLKTGSTLAAGAVALTASPAWVAKEAFAGIKKPLNPLRGKYAPLSNPIEDLKDAYDVVVIGSGYGGSVMASRLAQGRRLAVLERGKEWQPGEFPAYLIEIKASVRTKANPLGLYDMHINDELDVLVGNGLGGTSLINANVVIAPDKDVFDQPRWPQEIRQLRDSGKLDQLYSRVREMLKPERYPGSYSEMFRTLPKSRVFEKGAAATEGKFSKADVAVNFAGTDNRANHVGVLQALCTLCGDCVTGCNVGAKNTLNMNYLPLAKSRGAEIFTQIEVGFIKKLPGGEYEIEYVYRTENALHGDRRGVIRAKTVVVAAGTLGSAGIMLRSQKQGGIPMSPQLGAKFSGNADYLGVGYNHDQQTNAVGFGTRSGDRAKRKSGATIVAITDYRRHGTRPLGERFIVEEGAFPSGIGDLARAFIHNVSKLPRNPAKLFRTLLDQAGDSAEGALNHSMVYLGMGHDSANGQVYLGKDDQAKVRWSGIKNEPIFAQMDEVMRKHTESTGGTYVSTLKGGGLISAKNLTTVHPMGGCAMGASANDGVVNHRGQVYNPSEGAQAVHAGLYVADASIMPTSLGVNPLLTISALAEHIAEEMIQNGEV